MGQVRWTEEAARWLREIHDYVAEDARDHAQRVAREIYDHAESSLVP